MSAAGVLIENMQERMKHRAWLITRRGNYLRTFDTITGRATLKHLRKFAKMGQIILVPGDPQETAYNLGMQRMYLHIEGVMKMDTETIETLSERSTQ